jgi:hypothetical protein
VPHPHAQVHCMPTSSGLNVELWCSKIERDVTAHLHLRHRSGVQADALSGTATRSRRPSCGRLPTDRAGRMTAVQLDRTVHVTSSLSLSWIISVLGGASSSGSPRAGRSAPGPRRSRRCWPKSTCRWSPGGVSPRPRREHRRAMGLPHLRDRPLDRRTLIAAAARAKRRWTTTALPAAGPSSSARASRRPSSVNRRAAGRSAPRRESAGADTVAPY